LRCTYNGVHPTEKSNAQDVVEQSLTVVLKTTKIDHDKMSCSDGCEDT